MSGGWLPVAAFPGCWLALGAVVAVVGAVRRGLADRGEQP